MSDTTSMSDEPLRLAYDAVLAYTYAAGRYASHFMVTLRDEGRILAIRDPGSGKVLIPPRAVSGLSGEELHEWVEVGPQGTVTGCTIVETPFVDPMTGEQRPVPYGFGFVRLDGADTNIYHFLDATSHEEIEVGMRVEAVLKPAEEREGAMSDIMYFRRIDGEEGKDG
jgi:uncharacterized protein